MFPVATVTQIINNIKIPHQDSGSLMLGACTPMGLGWGLVGMVLQGPSPLAPRGVFRSS